MSQESPALWKAGMNWPSVFGEERKVLVPAETGFSMLHDKIGISAISLININ
jgi:hypothetical protein